MMGSDSERRFILQMIESGKISAGEGLRLLQALPAEDDPGLELEAAADPHTAPAPDPFPDQDEPSPVWTGAAPSAPETGSTAALHTEGAQEWEPPKLEAESGEVLHPGRSGQAVLTPDIQGWRRWWMLPLWTGVGITVLGALILYRVQQAAGVSFWLFCSSLPFLLGVALIVLAWQSRAAHWVHIRVDQKPGTWPQRIAISFPIPLGPAVWFLRTFKGRIPGLEESSVDEILQALRSSGTPQAPVFIEVDEGEDGEHVQVFVG